MSSPLWATRFGLSDRDVAALQTELSGKDEPLRWLLSNVRIPTQEYLQWAMETYGLPALRDAFFNIPADPIFWAAAKTQFDWTPSFFPLAEWQGVLLIGCLEPPAFHVPFTFEYRLVLASAGSLEKRFREYEPTKQFIPVPLKIPAQAAPAKTPKMPPSPPPATAPPPLAPIAVVLAAPVEEEAPPVVAPVPTPAPVPAPVVAAAVSTPAVRQRPADEVLAADLPPAPDVSLDDPDGLVFEIAPASSPNLFIVPDGLPLHDIGQPISTKPDGLEEDSMMMDLADLDFTSTSEACTAPTVKIETPAAAPKAPPAPVVVAAAPVVEKAPVEKPKLPDALPTSFGAAVTPAKTAVAPPSAPVMPPAPPVVMAKAMPIAPASAVTPPPLSQVTPSCANSETALTLGACSTTEALMVATVAQITSIFEHGVVFSFNRHELRPAKWSDLLLSAKGEKPDAINLEIPSIFRVAFRSSLPYHGYVAANPANQTFFNDFNRGIIAKHVTIVPVMVGGQLDAMIMGLSIGSVDFKASLLKMETLAADYAVHSGRLKVKKAA